MMRDLCRVTSRGRTEEEREMAWTVRAGAGALPRRQKERFFSGAGTLPRCTLRVPAFSVLG